MDNTDNIDKEIQNEFERKTKDNEYRCVNEINNTNSNQLLIYSLLVFLLVD